MRLLFFLTFVALLVSVFAWEKEDHEIFDLVSELEASEGKGTTFYSWLDVPSTATTNEIAKAYRKMSMVLHPDKNPNVKSAHERFARLGVISTILRNKESRSRYDFFYKNGVPKWRGTGYYYSRFRPGLGSVLVFLTVFTSGLQLLVQKLNYNRDLERINRFVQEARTAAWGPKGNIGEGKRKVRVNVGGPPRYDEDGNQTSGKWLDLVVKGSEVFVLGPSGELERLDPSTIPRPTLGGTWFIALLKSWANSAKNRVQGRTLPAAGDAEDDSTTTADEDTEGGEESSATGTSSTSGAKKALNGRPTPAVKAGGRRKKAVRSR